MTISMRQLLDVICLFGMYCVLIEKVSDGLTRAGIAEGVLIDCHGIHLLLPAARKMLDRAECKRLLARIQPFPPQKASFAQVYD